MQSTALRLQRARDAAGEADEMEDELDAAKQSLEQAAAALKAEQVTSTAYSSASVQLHLQLDLLNLLTIMVLRTRNCISVTR